MRRALILGGLGGALVLLAAACGGGNGGGQTTAPNVNSPPTGTAIIRTAAPRATPVPDPTRMVATIEGFGGTSVTGSAEATPVGGGSQIVVRASGLTPGKHSTYLKADSCDGSGQRFGPLTELEAGADGSAEATTSLPAARLGAMVPRNYHVVIYEGDNANQGAVVGCGALIAEN